ncbi:MAG: M56 family metallopeptidase [Ruminococcaceae bacterium]|nr:M56 family metallopeptidase [Oscillospiraceae bacterium]
MLINMFITFLNMSISGALAAILLILWRSVSYKFIPAKFYYILWSALIIRLLMPFTFASPISLLNVFKNTNRYSRGGRYVVTMEYLGYGEITDKISPGSDAYFLGNLALLWLIVAVSMIVLWLVVHLITQHRLRYAVLYKEKFVEQIRRDFSVRESVKVFVSPNVLSPIVIGFFKPRIILPKSENLEEKDLKYAIAHEMVHAKRYDQIVRFLHFVCLALHWYNPFVWWSFYLFNEDIETSCDQQVLSVYGMEHKRHYACVLVEYAGRKNSLQLGYLSFAKNKVAKRIEKVMAYRKMSITRLVIFSAVTLFIGFSVSTNPVFAEEYQYIPKTVFVTSETRAEITEFTESFIADIENKDSAGIAEKSTADSEFFAPVYKPFEEDTLRMEIDRIFYTSEDTADVHINLLENGGIIFGKDTQKLVAQIDRSRIMSGLYADCLYSYEKYNRINSIDDRDEAVQIVHKMIKFGLTDGENTPQNAPKITAFCMDMAYDRARDDSLVQIPQKTVEDIANEFFLFSDFTNLHKTDYFDSKAGVYTYEKSTGTPYEYRIVDFNKGEREAVVTVEFFKDPLHTQVEKTVKYTLKKE